MPSKSPAPNEDWTDEELRLIVDDYLEMLTKELVGTPYFKAHHHRALARRLSARSDGSLKFKYRNISAALEALGLDYIDGYKPARNYQRALLPLLHDRTRSLPESAKKALVAPSLERWTPPLSVDPRVVVTAPPEADRSADRGADLELERWSMRVAELVNWGERDARNRALGRAGEEFVVRLEQTRLDLAGKPALAKRVRHVAKLEGDGLGYDVLSFDPSGREKFVEVKTTVSGASAPFFVTRNEVEVSRSHGAQFVLSRVYQFRTHARVFELTGSISDRCRLEPTSFLARVG